MLAGIHTASVLRRTGVLVLLLALSACSRPTPAPVVYGTKPSQPAATAQKTAPAPDRERRNTDQDNAIPPGLYQVQRDDTLFAISRRSGVGLRDLIELNRLQAPFDLQAGQRIQVPAVRYHEVAAGETLYGISRHYGVPVNILVTENSIAPPYGIRTGQRLRIPDAANQRPAADQAPAVAATTPPTAGTAAPTPATKPATVRKSIGKPPPRASNRFAWPVQGRVLSRFGPKRGGLHNDGINIAVKEGTPVRAAENGVVAYIGNELRGYGNLLLLRHDGGWVTAYAHTGDVQVRVGQTVRRGQVIARAGATGNVESPQLHFEIRRGRKALDPLGYLSQKEARTVFAPNRPSRG
jgi:murein DD-endopeptidase MepM/ murein hydrolase activator NlpD